MIKVAGTQIYMVLFTPFWVNLYRSIMHDSISDIEF
jgi:hypothetical protein